MADITYTPGTLHARVLDDNTVALILPTDYAATVRDCLTKFYGSTFDSRMKYAEMVIRALTQLKDFPPINTGDMTADRTMFMRNEATQI